MVLICQVLLTFVYPAYLYGFISVEPSNQKFYVMLLPVIKIIAKNWISYYLGNKYDLMPQIMIFNVDVFNALYVSSSMQNSQSITTMLEMIALDALLGWVSISDISDLVKDVLRLRRKIPAGHPLKTASFIEITLQIIEEDPHARDRLVMRRYSSSAMVVRRWSGPSMSYMTAHLQSGSSSTSRQVLPVDLPNPTLHTTPEVKTASLRLAPVQKSLGSIFSPKERQRFLQQSARVLFTTEFVILVEYTEVIVLFIYSEYLLELSPCRALISHFLFLFTDIYTAMFYLPNHDYYPQI